jgi:hypothetical protein
MKYSSLGSGQACLSKNTEGPNLPAKLIPKATRVGWAGFRDV